VETTGALWVASDADELLAALHTEGAQALYQRLLENEVHSGAKIVMFARPDWLVTQGMLHPDKDTNEWARDLADLAQYTAALFGFEPDERQKLLRLKLRFAR
jgi:hypothetical protein